MLWSTACASDSKHAAWQRDTRVIDHTMLVITSINRASSGQVVVVVVAVGGRVALAIVGGLRARGGDSQRWTGSGRGQTAVHCTLHSLTHSHTGRPLDTPHAGCSTALLSPVLLSAPTFTCCAPLQQPLLTLQVESGLAPPMPSSAS